MYPYLAVNKVQKVCRMQYKRLFMPSYAFMQLIAGVLIGHEKTRVSNYRIQSSLAANALLPHPSIKTKVKPSDPCIAE